MAAFIKSILFTLGRFALFNFAKSNLGGAPQNQATVRVKVGLAADVGLDYGGGIARIDAYDTNNALLGQVEGTEIVAGDFRDFQVGTGTQTEYVTLVATSNAICMAWVTLSNADGQFDGAWTGDVGYGCGWEWNYGDQVAGNQDDGSEYRPFCTWLDGDHSPTNIRSAGLKINFGAFRNTGGSDSGINATVNQNAACSKTIFSPDSGEIDGVPNKRSPTPKARKPWMEDMLIVTSHPEHNARFLCDSPTSYGPDLMGLDGFCDMGKKTFSPLCSQENVVGCVELDGDQVHEKRSIKNRNVSLKKRGYSRIDKWE